MASTHGDDRIRVMGTKGTVEVRDNAVILIGEQGEQMFSAFADGDIFASFLAAVRGEGECAVFAEGSIAAVRAALMAQLAADTGEKMIF